MSKLGRNDPCHCGSGKKYKKCCLARDQPLRTQGGIDARDEPFIAELRPDLDEAVDRLMERLELGAGRSVEPEIKAMLEKHPGYHLTHYAMGVYLAMVRNDAVGAMPYFEKAVQLFPPFPEAHFNLGNSARKACDIPKAVAAYRSAIRYSQDDDKIAAMARDELQFLERLLLESSPFQNLDKYLANAKLFDEAFVRLTERNFEEAAQLFNRVLNENPNHVQSFGNLALAYAGLGKREVALECLEKALALDPRYEPALSNRRVIAKMRDGEPFVPAAIHETHYYAELLNRAR
jgi:tetratricopeptide (TPR) repeat protein